MMGGGYQKGLVVGSQVGLEEDDEEGYRPMFGGGGVQKGLGGDVTGLPPSDVAKQYIVTQVDKQPTYSDFATKQMVRSMIILSSFTKKLCQ